ncbi:hypothetical protein KIW84_010528 [Lathyrus oleraceus]|uniref:SRP54-type proteins GTP-binding domain-containing protein n=1 Tax=Pisum sativum TaxID=3888 RepID=A0A9D5BBJ1_PEA|nr:hypothetical protein KIW84_010528 [Pisum sativum]
MFLPFLEKALNHSQEVRNQFWNLQFAWFEKVYEKDPAIVAKEAIQEASRNGSDVVLVDTAGHMQDNEPLMRALSKLIYLNNLHTEILLGTWVPALNIFESSLRRRNCAEAR